LFASREYIFGAAFLSSENALPTATGMLSRRIQPFGFSGRRAKGFSGGRRSCGDGDRFEDCLYWATEQVSQPQYGACGLALREPSADDVDERGDEGDCDWCEGAGGTRWLVLYDAALLPLLFDEERVSIWD
jgi:hypothetical protein